MSTGMVATLWEIADADGPADGNRPAAPALGKLLFTRVAEGDFHAPVRRLPPDVHLYSWGDTGDWLYLIQSGWVKTMTWSWHGKPCLLSICGPTDLIGVCGFLARRRTETAMTKTVTEVRVITPDQFNQIVADPALREAWDHYLTARIAEQQEALTHFVTLDSEHRLAATLLYLARKLGSRAGSRLSISCRLTHDELAQIVGTTRSRVGYFLKRFDCKQLIERRTRALVVHEDRVLEYLLSCS